MEDLSTRSSWGRLVNPHPLSVLQSVDTAFLQSTISKTMQKSASVHLLFGFEYVILASIVVSVFIKYTLSLIDNYLEGRWENKVTPLPK